MEEATIAKIATEALKPVSSIIDALLSSKLQRIRNWAEKRELNNRLGSTVISVLLDQYLHRLLRRICGVTTIVFPQQVLPLTSIYEPLSLNKRYGTVASQKSDFDVKALKAGHNYLIVDSAGMGKSTFAKHLALEILNSTTKIPMFLELRRIADSESLLGKLSAEIDETKKDVDEKLLLMLLDEGNFVIILDGYDELSDQSRERIGQQITELAVRSDNNSLILTARPEVSLPELPNSKIFSIDALSKSQAKSLVLRYDAVASIDVGKKLIEQFDVVSERFLETPLLVVLLYRTYGFNQSIATRISSFYDEVFNALYKGHDLSKAGFARAKSSQLDSEDFRRLLRGFSFLLAARQKDNIKTKTEGIKIVNEAIRLTSVNPITPSSFFDDLLLAVPLLVKEGTDYRFIHRSIGEFFAAEFLAFQPNSEQIIERIRDGQLYQSFTNSLQYLSDINPSLFRRLIVAPLAKSVLDEENPIQDPYIRSICFRGQARLGLWPYDKYTRKRKDNIEVTIPRDAKFGRTSYFYGELKNKNYILAAASSKVNKELPEAAWESITKEVKGMNLYSHTGNNFDGLDKVFVEEQWVFIDDELVLNNANHPMIRVILRRLLAHQEFSFKGRRRLGKVGRILDEHSCKNLLRQIQQEDETQGWLEALISGK